MKDKPLVSVIVPTKNSEKTIAACLASINTQTYKNIELIVVDNSSNDKTKELARQYTKYVFNKGPERSAQRNFGALKSKGEYLLFIDSDMELTKKVVENCVSLMSKGNVKGIIIPEKSIGDSFWAKCKALERSFYVGIDWLEAARFFSKDTFEKVKGYDEKQTGTEDYDLPQRIKKQYGEESIGRIKSLIIHDEGDLALSYTLKKKYYYARTMGNYVHDKNNARYLRLQGNPLERYRLFFKNPKNLIRNPILSVGMLFMKTSEFIAGGMGFVVYTTYKKHE